MDFSHALDALKEGHELTRTGWNAPNQGIRLQTPDQKSKMTLPYIYIRTVNGHLVPWVTSQTDVLAEDWQVVD